MEPRGFFVRDCAPFSYAMVQNWCSPIQNILTAEHKALGLCFQAAPNGSCCSKPSRFEIVKTTSHKL